jgi:hypothetical protein
MPGLPEPRAPACEGRIDRRQRRADDVVVLADKKSLEERLVEQAAL